MHQAKLIVSASLQEPETAEAFEKTFGTHLPENDLPEATRINKQSHDLVNAEHDLQIAKAIEKTHNPISISEEVDAHLPEIASELLRYYELWNCHYTKWPGLNEFSNHLRDVNKGRVHNSFKMEIKVLRKLFADEHPAQMRLSQLEGQLKAKQMPRKIKKTYRRKISKSTKMLTKKEVVKEEIEIAKNSVIAKGYHRINKHYEDYHEASTQLVKRNLSDDGNEVFLATKRARTTK
ncbi:2784_t:CDS:2 [Ambispora leptoticha]|uniref:2784_t:CDS:1 n=1 Tax=Ambispora leptoticha TaxID=144679 RepID=A0A9N9AHY8_9GLOM|nr:2784_t:CDS:2 [Ambispora leptoticha]